MKSAPVRWLVATALVVLVSASAVEAGAQELGQQEREEGSAEAARQAIGVAREREAAARRRAMPPPRESYGWQSILADTGVVFLVPAGGGAAGITTRSLVFTTYGLYVAAGPVVHLAHGRPATAALSATLRVAPGALAVLLRERERDPFDLSFSELVVIGAHMIAISIVDAAVLSREPAPDTARAGATFTPRLTPRREGGLDLSLGAAF